MTLVRLKPAAPRSRVKHSTTEPLRSLKVLEWSLHYTVVFKTLKGSELCSYWMGVAENQTHSIYFFMVVLVTCKNEEDPIKNEDTRVVTTLSINFKMLNGS